MNSLPEHPEPDLRHPAWCDPSHCTALDERPDAVHSSAPVVVPAVQPYGEVRIEAWLLQTADAPVDECEATLILSFNDARMGCLPYQFTVELESPKAQALLSTLEPLVAMLKAYNEGQRPFHVDPNARWPGGERRIEPGGSGPGW